VSEELGKRLRDANPVPSLAGFSPDDLLLARITTERREGRMPARRLGHRRALVVLIAALLLIGGLTAGGSKFAPRYFGADDRDPIPAPVLAQLRELARNEGGVGGLDKIDETQLVRLAAFETESGEATIYVAPMREGSGYCSVETVGAELGGGSCSGGEDAEAIPYMGSGSGSWGDMHVLLGRLTGSAARIEVRFEDGEVRSASLRSPWWVYVVGGDRTEPGHRPIGLTAFDAAGTVVAKQPVKPYYYTAKGAVERLLPESDGSPGQDAIVAMLAGLGAGPWLEQDPVNLDRTQLLRHIETARGELNVFTAPWGDGGVCFGYGASSPGLVPGVSGCPANESVAEQKAVFDPGEVIAGRAHGIVTIDGPPPLGSARVLIAFADGTRKDVDLFVTSSFAAWLGPEQLTSAHHPVALIALDARGEELARVELDLGQG